ncbi:VOC family protein [uncultured Sphingomonas sp.]|uniref:VOC family protein n=1 Tax=uncultured Sphingomonas sp. TaxID=158754 RepID=UPI0025F90D90|nr:VOC family protein [uncultured Sphingomonas sp.]
MSVVPHSIDIVVADMAASARFYRDLGLAVPEGAEEEAHVQIDTPGGATIGLMSEAIIRGADPEWQTPVGQRVTFACRCDDAAEVDAAYARMIAAGHRGLREPWDSPWGQHYAMLADPDGNRVDLFAD